jgi:hypothetical protein
MKDFGEIFGLGVGYFNPRSHVLTKEEFLQDLSSVTIKFADYESCKHTLIAMLGLRAASQDDQKQAVLSVLNYNANIEVYV